MFRFSRRVPHDLRRNRLSEARARLAEVPYDLTVTNPTLCDFPYPDELLAPLSHPRGLTYRPDPRGAIEARRAVAAAYARSGHDVDPDRVVLTASTSEAYGAIFKLLCDPGDTVVLPTPSYPLFDQLTRLEAIDRHALALDPDDDWRPRMSQLTAAPPTTRAVVLVHPNNPTGSFIHPDDSVAITDVCRERGWALVADEVFLQFVLDGGPGRDASFATVHDCLTFTLGGLSKSLGLPQLKLAWIIVGGPDDHVAAALDRLDHITDASLSVGTPVSLAAPQLFDDASSVFDAIIDRCLANLQHLRRVAASRPWLTVPAVGGGWSVTIRLPAILDDEEIAVRLLAEHGVAVHPGFLFDLPHQSSLVFSLLTPIPVWTRALEVMLAALDEWLAGS